MISYDSVTSRRVTELRTSERVISIFYPETGDNALLKASVMLIWLPELLTVKPLRAVPWTVMLVLPVGSAAL